MSRPTISVLLVDDNEAFRDSIRALLQPQSDLQVVGEAADGAGALRQVARLAPDIVIMDVNLPGQSGITITRQILTSTPRVKVLALSVHAEDQFASAMKNAGASGYVLKDHAFEQLVNAIRSLADGRSFFPDPKQQR